MYTLETELNRIAQAAFSEALQVEAPALLKRAQDAKHGDYQVNGVLPLAKREKLVPRDVALKVAAVLEKHPAFQSASVAGPGFINLTLTEAFLTKRALEMASDAKLGIPEAERKERIVVDFSGPNIAKQMHIGHIRSTILGDTLIRILRAMGHEVLGDNHLGDWGTQFGLLIAGMRAFGSEASLEERPIEELERIYKLATAKAKEDEVFAEEARNELAKLQAGETKNLALWEKFVHTTRIALDRVYARLAISFDMWMGESKYNAMLPGMIETLRARDLVRESEGALCVFFGELESSPKELKAFKEPFIVQKRDGAFLYSTTDLATMFYRQDTLKADRSLYVVDARQAHHFKQVFALGSMMGIHSANVHLGFGSILGPDNKPLKTRDGQAVMLESVLNEAIERARARITEEGLEVPEAELDEVARKVGIGAVKYADLRQHRASDYVFDWDKLISFKGNAGPTIQYAIARVRSIFRKGALPLKAPLFMDASLRLTTPEERALALHLVRFGDAVKLAADLYEPHQLTDYLFELTRRFSGFYEACPILKCEDHAVKNSRLSLAFLTSEVLARGLGMMGIETVDRM
jgi:arginyl-tRNA synthetase